jgi:metal-responsive CopG/Arc/MetJ family transcriptional regulator
MSERKTIKRGAIRKDKCTFIGVWVPNEMVTLLDHAVVTEDLDRSKYLRRALEQKIKAA